MASLKSQKAGVGGSLDPPQPAWVRTTGAPMILPTAWLVSLSMVSVVSSEIVSRSLYGYNKE